MPGNWFELKNTNTDKTVPYDIEMLKEEITNQVNNRSEKLNFIDISFGKKYKKNTVDDIKFHLDENKFAQIANMLQSETRHPIITFHGSSHDAVKSIIDGGYIIPGTGKIKKTHGSAYGNGVYSSPFFDKAMYYTCATNTKCVYILINMVFLGKMKMIPPSNSLTDFSKPVNGVYKDGSNTRIVYGLEQLICADSQRIIPVAIMEINIG